MSALELAPITLKQAHLFVLDHHRHHDPAVGGLFAVSLLRNSELVGVAIAGRPVSQGLQDGRTLEILRCCVLPGVPNGCSMLYRSLVRAGEALGYLRFITYIREDEDGRSLKAAGFELRAMTRGGFWSRRARKRRPNGNEGRKQRWEAA